MHYFINKNNICLFASQMQILDIYSLIESAESPAFPLTLDTKHKKKHQEWV